MLSTQSDNSIPHLSIFLTSYLYFAVELEELKIGISGEELKILLMYFFSFVSWQCLSYRTFMATDSSVSTMCFPSYISIVCATRTTAFSHPAWIFSLITHYCIHTRRYYVKKRTPYLH